MFKELEHTLTLQGKGETVERAFNDIFAQIKNQLSKEILGLLIRIEPKNVKVLKAEEFTYTERFLGLLFPRKRTMYSIQAKVTVRVGVVDASQIEFEKYEDHPSRLQHILKMQ